jgi:hypothetical protein
MPMSNRVTIDRPTLRNIARHRIRLERIQKLAALDIDFQRALEVADTTAQAAIAAKKQALRDAPTAADIEDINTIEDAIYYVPESFEE